MGNLLLGLQAIAHSINVTVIALLHHPVVWGFALGFAASTGTHLVVVGGNPRHTYHMLTKPPDRCYGLVCPPALDGTVARSYEDFCHDHHRVRLLSYTTALAFLGVVLVALLRY